MKGEEWFAIMSAFEKSKQDDWHAEESDESVVGVEEALESDESDGEDDEDSDDEEEGLPP